MTTPPEPRAWIEDLLEAHEGALVAYARGLTGDLERARDAVQEAFLELLGLERATVEGHARRWLFAVTRNRALDALRKERPVELVAHPCEGRADDASDPASLAMRTEALADLDGELARLPDAQREVLELRFRHGLRYAEIAHVTRHSTGHVGWLIHHGLRGLRRRLERAEDTA